MRTEYTINRCFSRLRAFIVLGLSFCSFVFFPSAKAQEAVAQAEQGVHHL